MNNYTHFLFYPIVLWGYLFLYIPLFTLIIYSFNSNPFTQEWHGFTLKWYTYIFQSPEIIQAISTSFFIAMCTAFLTIVLSLFFILCIHHTYKKLLLNFFYIILAIPEIMIAVSLLNFLGFSKIPVGISSIIAGHTLLGIAYAIPIVNIRYEEIDKRLIEAAYDLGATELQVFTTILLPLLKTTILASSSLIFIISLDDFLISFFCAGSSIQTLPLYIFSMIRAGAAPSINALSALLLCCSMCGLIFFSYLQRQTR